MTPPLSLNMTGTHDDIIEDITYWPVDLPLVEPFTVATGARTVAENVFIRVMLRSGICGYGEAAPFPEVAGEDRRACLRTLKRLAPQLIGQSIHNYRPIAANMADIAPSQPATRCGLETALLDAYCRSVGQPMWHLWGGTDVRPRETDMTIPIATLTDTLRLANRWYHKGFRLFKMKVGRDVDADIVRLEAVHRAYPDVSFIVDANQGFSREDCLSYIKGVRRHNIPLLLLEQPVPRDDLDSMAALRHDVGVPIAADESVRSLNDAHQVVNRNAADYINIKIMKSGVLEAAAIASYALKAGLRLMAGGMIESRIAMGCSFSLVLGMAGFDILDLDTPLLLACDPLRGGYRYQCPVLEPWTGAGLDISVPIPADAVITRL